MNYYQNIKDILVKNEIYKQVKDYSKNKHDLESYYEVGKLLIEAQGGEERAKYGNQLIKEYSERLTKELGKGFSTRNLRNMRQFYLKFQKWQALPAILSWSHITELLPLKDIQAINYYIYVAEKQNLSYRELRERIKAKEYERIGYKEELKEPKINTLIKNPVIIKTKNIPDKLTEYALHQLILEDMDNFLKELGIGFAYIGHEVKIKIDNEFQYIDFLLFNTKYNCYVVLEIKIEKMKSTYIGQVLNYMKYIDKHIKESFHQETIGVILCKKENKFVLEYCTDYKIFTTTFQLTNNS